MANEQYNQPKKDLNTSKTGSGSTTSQPQRGNDDQQIRKDDAQKKPSTGYKDFSESTTNSSR